jgi:hypothetical protein
MHGGGIEPGPPGLQRNSAAKAWEVTAGSAQAMPAARRKERG